MHKNKESFEVLPWMKLDNAATIYPPTLSMKFAAMFRFTITFKEQVDPVILNTALNNIMNRFPTFKYRLRRGLFWNYFSYIKGNPIIKQDVRNPMLRINFEENNHYMFRIRYFDSRIAIEVFHALTDGTGGIVFLSTLAGEYLRLKYGVSISYNSVVLDPKEKPSIKEKEDSFKKYAKKVGGLEKESPAYHIPGTIEEEHVINIITGTMPITSLKKVARKYKCTITEFLASMMILSIQSVSEKSKKKNNKPIKISIPVNLRRIYPSITLRNFSSYINVGIESKYGHYTLEEIINIVKSNMSLMHTEKSLNAKITGNVKIANNVFVRCIPMFIKKYILSIGERLMGDRYCSNTLSNMGIVNLPKEMEKYVSEMGFIIGRSRGKPSSCSCISYKNNLYITFSRKIKETEMERIFFSTLVEIGIPVLIESNEGR